jgi:hypothetical protein
MSGSEVSYGLAKISHTLGVLFLALAAVFLLYSLIVILVVLYAVDPSTY